MPITLQKKPAFKSEALFLRQSVSRELSGLKRSVTEGAGTERSGIGSEAAKPTGANVSPGKAKGKDT